MAHPAAIARFLRGEAEWFLQTPSGEFGFAPPAKILLPGSFNPLHHGHATLADLAAKRLGGDVAFELSIANVDKPDLEPDELLRRLGQFQGNAPVYVTRAPQFANKAQLFPGSVFVVGADTAVRIVHPKYYGDDRAKMLGALEQIRTRACRFFVGGRIDAAGKFVDVGGLPIPEGFRDLFAGVEEREFRVDVSSSELRREHSRFG